MNRMSWKSVMYLLGLLLLVSCTGDSNPVVKKNLLFARKRLAAMSERLANSSENPRSLEENEIVLVKSKDWTSGFFPGCLWLMYEATGEEKWRERAVVFTRNLESEQYNGRTHDMGFKMMCSYGNGYRLSPDSVFKGILIQSAKTLSSRFNPRIGCIRSWDHHKDVWQYPVIIDNMMNLELLFWATRQTGDSTFSKIAHTHALTTLKNQFRSDYSSWHVVNYDTTTGAIINKQTFQGYSDESCWARGQSWALYGFTMCYRETGDVLFLQHAQKIADYILLHPNLPDDLVPYWDYNSPDIPDEYRDASAAAIMGSALFELCQYPGKNSPLYREKAEQLLENLSTGYLARDKKYFILAHSVGHKPHISEVDVPLIYADYYFLEMNLRKMKLDKNTNLERRLDD